MTDGKEQARSIRLPPRVWAALDEDARRCRRSPVRQLEALLIEWYELEDITIRFPKRQEATQQVKKAA